MINASINQLKTNQSVSIFFLQKNLTAVQKKTHSINKHLNFRNILHHFLLYNIRHGHLTDSSRQLCIEVISHCLRPYGSLLDAFLLLQCWCGHIFYDELQKSND